MSRPLVLLLQLPIPPPGPQPVRGNVPLAAGYLKMFARLQGLEESFEIEIFPPRLANTLSDWGLVEAILERRPLLVGFTCYLWNIDRALWVAGKIKERRPDIKIIVGGPEITADNGWVLDNPAVDFASIGEGEQTFSELLSALRVGGLHHAQCSHHAPRDEAHHAERDGYAGRPINGLFVRGHSLTAPNFRAPLAKLDQVSSPYLAGILDAADEQMLLLETIRGCIFKCKFCYYPKSYDDLYFVSTDKIVANLRHAADKGVREVVLLDPTLNQRRDFHEFLRLLARCNPDRQFTYFGELRGEGIFETARLLRDANFTEVEIGLQSIDPHAQELMDRKNNLKAFERGAKAMLDCGIKVKVDLIIGLPGDTARSVRRGIVYLKEVGLYSDVQVFNLAILPGTAFRQDADRLGLKFQPRPPYYVLQTPTLGLAEMYQLMQEAQETFEAEFDPFPPPVLHFESSKPEAPARETFKPEAPARESFAGPLRVVYDNLDGPPADYGGAAGRAQAFTIWLRSADFARHCDRAAERIDRVLADNPHTTLQVILEPTADPRSITPELLEHLAQVCHRQPTYLDRMYSLQPGRPTGAKRLIVLLPAAERSRLGHDRIADIGEYATLVWHGDETIDDELDAHEFQLESLVAAAAL